ncbi:MAG TPA: 4'-phosphopantetheinyl transferase superfamily protein [Planctomycetota bacterium]|jgi:4'-phosphopantetheinyl transferase
MVAPLPENEVHVWRIDLHAPAERVAEMRRVLPLDEQRKADRFHFQRDKDAYILAHGTVRLLLSSYLNQSPSDFVFEHNAYGKPSLVGKRRMRFNLTHTRGLALCAFAQGRELGVDAEWVREDFATRPIAERYFSAGEVAALMALPEQERAAAFFRCWTRKEAFVKARGQGLSIPLASFEVSLDEPARLLRVESSLAEQNRWFMHAFDLGAEHAGAVVVEGPACKVLLRRWEACAVS